jgi:hypothetical protein
MSPLSPARTRPAPSMPGDDRWGQQSQPQDPRVGRHVAPRRVTGVPRRVAERGCAADLLALHGAGRSSSNGS